MDRTAPFGVPLASVPPADKRPPAKELFPRIKRPSAPMPRLQLNDLHVHYQQRGAGPDVVLLHAFTSNLSVWFLTPLVETLASEFRVTTYDLRGHGLTTATSTGYDSAQLARDFRDLHSALQLEPAWLVGHSYGGVVATHAALDFPEIVRGVILSDTYFPGLRHLEPAMGQAEPWRDLRATFQQLDIDLGPAVDFSRLFQVVAGLTKEQQAQLTMHMGAPGTRWLSQMGQLAKTTAGAEMFSVAGLTSQRIASVKQPVVALYDEFSPFTATRGYLQDHLQRCTTDVVPGANHLAPVQNPAEFTRLVQWHLRRETGRLAPPPSDPSPDVPQPSDGSAPDAPNA